MVAIIESFTASGTCNSRAARCPIWSRSRRGVIHSMHLKLSIEMERIRRGELSSVPSRQARLPTMTAAVAVVVAVADYWGCGRPWLNRVWESYRHFWFHQKSPHHWIIVSIRNGFCLFNCNSIATNRHVQQSLRECRQERISSSHAKLWMFPRSSKAISDSVVIRTGSVTRQRFASIRWRKCSPRATTVMESRLRTRRRRPWNWIAATIYWRNPPRRHSWTCWRHTTASRSVPMKQSCT